ncbi:MAG: protein tyrosine phosphatase [Selenomonadaceae bacterium]|nr:protein tyrosine phosphatase [Selenomonadaceae bacterium]
MAKRFLIGALIILVSVLMISATSAKKIEGTWRLDGSASAELRNFRLMTDDWQNDSRGREPSRAGLEKLWASASGQPSLAALKTLKQTIYELEPDAKIFIIDLRQESHGFANSIPVSWYIKNNAANANKTLREIESDEIERLNNLRGLETTFEPLGNADKQSFKPITIMPRFMETEQAAAEKLGINYERFAAADMQFPAPEVVDDFIIFVANLPENAWLHFHCQAGHGRTTTFLVMYDILKNPELSLEEICRRQYLLGGSNLLLEPEGDDWNSKMARDRAKKIRLFYDWAQGTRAEQIGLQWSEWLQLGNRD